MTDDEAASEHGASSQHEALVPVLTDGPIVVGVDGSANARRSVSVAADLARRFDRELVVVHALGIMTVVDGEHVPSEGRRELVAQLLESVWCAPLRDVAELRWSCRLVDGNPADVLAKLGEETDASFVVVGSRGAGQEKMLGSTSHHLVHHCDRPVVVVPPADRAPH